MIKLIENRPSRWGIVVLFAIIIGSGLLLGIAHANGSSNTDNLVVKNVKRLQLSIPAGTPEEVKELKSLYTSDGWKIDEKLNTFYKDVTYKDELVEIEGDTFYTDENGEVSTKISTRKGEQQVDIVTQTYDTGVISIGDDKGEATESVVVENKDVHKVEIVEDISVDGLMQKMGENNTSAANMENKQGSTTLAVPLARVNTTRGSNYNIQLLASKTGDRVTCNRYNGPYGNNTYYDKFKHPVKAAKNFFKSDCDYALVKSKACLKDYGPAKYRYCAWSPKSKNGKCSGIIKRKKTFHRH
ncbi:hypothetical protein [Listeria seeligeri]|uniref:hypothetical protein n=1 Tax=Listeria seeligeri TaxID=1640 RepID=UPI0016284E49|nr:hypothetical protein [Listeria seeligeri]MBC1430651.1 hypothetical protein [Listeria seeligeri]